MGAKKSSVMWALAAGLMMSGLPAAEAQEVDTGWRSEEERAAAEQLASVLTASEYLYGRTASDTIVYGDLVAYGNWYECGGYGFRRLGRGICVFDYSASLPHRGTFREWDTWSEETGNPLGLGGDPFDGGSYGADTIYPADMFNDSYIYCGSIGAWYYYIAMDHFFNGPGSCDATAAFPEDTEMEIRGDGGWTTSTADDHVYGWNNHDVLMGDGGDDFLSGRKGSDSLDGGPGEDYLNPGLYQDPCGSENEYVYGGFVEGDGDDWIDALYGRLYGGSCTLHLYGGRYGNDTIRGSPYADVISGGAGEDRLYGHGGADYIYGGNDDDLLCGGVGTEATCDGCNPTVPPGDECATNCNNPTSCETYVSPGACGL